MAVFDVFKQWADKLINNKVGDEKALEELYQDNVNVETPREELFKQNIFMGDTTRPEHISEEDTSEPAAFHPDESLALRQIDSINDKAADLNDSPNPEYSNFDSNSNSANNSNTNSITFPSTNDANIDTSDTFAATQLNPTPAFNEYNAPFTTNGSPGANLDPNDNDTSVNSNLSPVVDADATDNSVNETSSVGDVVGVTALASDADASDTVSYSLSDDAGGAFAIDSVTGEVTVADPSVLDFAVSLILFALDIDCRVTGSSSKFTIVIADRNVERLRRTRSITRRRRHFNLHRARTLKVQYARIRYRHFTRHAIDRKRTPRVIA